MKLRNLLLLTVGLCGLLPVALKAQLVTNVFVTNETDSNGTGYVNNPKFVVDSTNTGYFGVLTHDTDNNYNNELFGTSGAWNDATSFNHAFLSNMGSVNVENSPQRVSSVASYSTSNVVMMWYGSDYAESDSNYNGHQIHYGRFPTALPLAPATEEVPLTISGFQTFYTEVPPYTNLYWQEHAAAAITPNQTIGVVWEARDASRTSGGSTYPTGSLQPGIAYISRDSAGTWSNSGSTSTPPYLSVSAAGNSTEQSRPTIVSNSNSLVHILAYGEYTGHSNQQILYGNLDPATGVSSFSGWSLVHGDSNDQRHESAAIDPSGNVHVVWREIVASPFTVTVYYSMRSASTGTWSTPVAVSDAGMWGSTPVVSADSSTVRVAWIEWNGSSGFVNSLDVANNGITSTDYGDDDVVEGNLMFSSKPNGSGSFSTPVKEVSDLAAYPNFAVGATTGLIFELWYGGCTTYPFTGCTATVRLGQTH